MMCVKYKQNKTKENNKKSLKLKSCVIIWTYKVHIFFKRRLKRWLTLRVYKWLFITKSAFKKLYFPTSKNWRESREYL